jgi:anti-sigma B factor antagonist
VSDDLPPFDVTLTPVAEDVTVSVHGELDIVTVARFASALTDAIRMSERRVRVDLHDVSYFGSEGVRALVDGQRLAEEHDRTLSVVNPSSIASRLLRVVGLDELIDATAAG